MVKHQRKEPLSDGALRNASLPTRQGIAIDPEERSQLTHLAHEGLAQLRGARIGRGESSAGVEWEMTVTTESGDPYPCAPHLLEKAATLKKRSPEKFPGTATGEYAAFNVELNSEPFIGLGSGFLTAMHRSLSAQVQAMQKIARGASAQLSSVGILPSIMPCHLEDRYITNKQRYFDLEVALAEEHLRKAQELNFHFRRGDKGWFVNFRPDGLHIKSPDRPEVVEPLLESSGRLVRYNALDTSVQFHWGVANQENYVRDHRISELISSIMVGVCANSPLVLGQVTGLEENRLFVYATMLHPGRVVMSRQWLRHDLGQIEDALRCGVILGSRGSKLDGMEPTPYRALQLLQGTTWPLNRTVVSFDEATNQRVLRIEHRPIPAQPTVADTMGAAALFYGLMSGMPEYLNDCKVSFDAEVSPEALERRLSFLNVVHNVGRACTEGLQSEIVWFDGHKRQIRELVVDELLPVAHHGLHKLGVSQSERDSYLGVIERRLNAGRASDQLGVTPADLIRGRFFKYEPLSGAEASCREISLWLSDILRRGSGDDLKGIYDLDLEDYNDRMRIKPRVK